MAHHYEHFWLDPKFWVAVSFVLFLLRSGSFERATDGLEGTSPDFGCEA